VVVSFGDVATALKVIAHARQINPGNILRGNSEGTALRSPSVVSHK